jgi:hypothetical protein
VVSIADLLQVDELDVAATGSDSHDHCPVPSFEPPTSRKGEPPAPIAKRTVLPLRIRQIEWTDCRVPFEVWQLRDDKHRIVFNVVPLQ